MSGRIADRLALLTGDPRADRVVPPAGATARLTVLTSAAMAFLAVFALALSLATGRLADRWAEALAEGATIRISAAADQMAAQTERVLDILMRELRIVMTQMGAAKIADISRSSLQPL